jgi:hypothetical protein
MGEVYRALDPRLGREVAVKILPEPFSHSPDRLARFKREAQLLAALSHPGIAVVHEVGEAAGGLGTLHYLVMELVLGETLADRLARGPLPQAEALRVAHEVAGALAAAHDKGIVHRDLKPSNVMLAPDGRVRVLDFGLATALDPPSGAQDPEGDTLSRRVTLAGTVLGTPGYMSPEQARGRSVDRRSDLWSLGCVLYEMLSGRSPFAGPTVPDVQAAVLHSDPDWSRLPSGTPPRLRRLVERCLEKDLERRLRDAHDAGLEIESLLQEASGSGGRAGRGPWLVAAGLGAALVAVLALVLGRPRGEPGGPGRSAPPRLSQLTISEGVESAPAFSPDGRSLAFVSEASGLRQVVVRRLDDGRERRVAGGELDSLQPAFSPDGQRLAFVRARRRGERLEPGDVFGSHDDADVWTVELDSGREARLLENAFNPSYSPDGTQLAVDASWAGPRRLWVTDAQGRNPHQATSDTSEGASHVRPRWSPDGRRLVYQHIERTRFDIHAVELATQAVTPLTSDQTLDIHPVFSPSGRSVYFSSHRGGGLNIWRLPARTPARAAGSSRSRRAPARTSRPRSRATARGSRSRSCARTPTSIASRSRRTPPAPRDRPRGSSRPRARTAAGPGPPTGARSRSTPTAPGT